MLQGAFESLDNEDDEDVELDVVARRMAKAAAAAVPKPKDDDDDDDDDDVEEEDGEEDGDDDEEPKEKKEDHIDDDDDADDSSEEEEEEEEEVVEEEEEEKAGAAGKVRGKKRSLTAEALALGSLMIRSKKVRFLCDFNEKKTLVFPRIFPCLPLCLLVLACSRLDPIWALFVFRCATFSFVFLHRRLMMSFFL